MGQLLGYSWQYPDHYRLFLFNISSLEIATKYPVDILDFKNSRKFEQVWKKIFAPWFYLSLILNYLTKL